MILRTVQAPLAPDMKHTTPACYRQEKMPSSKQPVHEERHGAAVFVFCALLGLRSGSVVFGCFGITVSGLGVPDLAT